MLIDKQNYLTVQIDGRGKKGEPNYLLCLRLCDECTNKPRSEACFYLHSQKFVFSYIRCSVKLQ